MIFVISSVATVVTVLKFGALAGVGVFIGFGVLLAGCAAHAQRAYMRLARRLEIADYRVCPSCGYDLPVS